MKHTEEMTPEKIKQIKETILHCRGSWHKASQRLKLPASKVKTLADELERELWNAYTREPSDDHRNRLAMFYDGWLAGLCRRWLGDLPSSVDGEAMVQEARIAVLETIPRYDPKRGSFKQFSNQRIYGACMDYLRGMDPVPRLSRLLAKQRKQLEEQGIDPLEHMERCDYRRSLTPGEISLSTVVGTSNDGDREITLEQVLAGRLQECELERDAFFTDVLAACTLEEKTLIYLYYNKSHTHAEIGAILRVSESRVSQIHKAILQHVRLQLANRGEYLDEASP